MDFYLWFVPSSKKYAIVLWDVMYFTNQIFSLIKLIMFFEMVWGLGQRTFKSYKCKPKATNQYWNLNFLFLCLLSESILFQWIEITLFINWKIKFKTGYKTSKNITLKESSYYIVWKFIRQCIILKVSCISLSISVLISLTELHIPTKN